MLSRVVTGKDARGPQPSHGVTLAQAAEKYLRTCGNTKLSIQAKTFDLNYFTEYVERILGKEAEITSVTPNIVRGFMEERERRHRESPATITRRFFTVKRLFNVVKKEIPELQNPTDDITPPKPAEPEPDSFSLEDLKKILEVIRTRHYAHEYQRLQDELMVYCGTYCGFRGMDIRTVKIMHFCPKSGFFMGLKRKANRYQNVPIRPHEIEMIQKFLPIREAFLVKKFPRYASLHERIKRQYPLIISPYGAELLDPDSWQYSEKSIWKKITDLGKEAGVKVARPHMFRHSSGRMALEAGNDIVKVSQLLGHESVKTTMRYVQNRTEQIKDLQSKMVEI